MSLGFVDDQRPIVKDPFFSHTCQTPTDQKINRMKAALGGLFDRPGVAGAVLQTALLLINSVTVFLKYLHNIINHKR